MNIRLYAVLRDLYGADKDLIELPEGSTVKELLEMLGRRSKALGDFMEKRVSSIITLVNGLYAPQDQKLRDGDVVDLLPPASGGCNDFRIVSRDEMPSLQDILRDGRRHAEEEGLGALLIYVGIVKSPVNGVGVNELYYEVYKEYTLKRFEEISQEIRRRYRVKYVRIYHAEGSLRPGDPAMIISIQGVGRRETLEAMRESIELIKHTTGIWKIEKREDGEYWVIGDGERISRASRDR
ncbi:MAG: MoaD family protein [Desulfurococcales archaeon]|nr:MoaD family protein [Desulfurococcales archaeon]